MMQHKTARDFTLATNASDLSIVIPQVKFKRVRALPLDDFEPVTFGIFWQGKNTPVLQALLSRIQQVAQVLTS